ICGRRAIVSRHPASHETCASMHIVAAIEPCIPLTIRPEGGPPTIFDKRLRRFFVSDPLQGELESFCRTTMIYNIWAPLLIRHCEERSDVTISKPLFLFNEIAVPGSQ
ncbi:MAG: hypothetical protein GWO88_01495, partial [Planctomycetia bacterium]|nr:hypothetical protein [Planctomycetia bacterium]